VIGKKPEVRSKEAETETDMEVSDKDFCGEFDPGSG
jgi:hypothetical protein